MSTGDIWSCLPSLKWIFHVMSWANLLWLLLCCIITPLWCLGSCCFGDTKVKKKFFYTIETHRLSQTAWQNRQEEQRITRLQSHLCGIFASGFVCGVCMMLGCDARLTVSLLVGCEWAGRDNVKLQMAGQKDDNDIYAYIYIYHPTYRMNRTYQDTALGSQMCHLWHIFTVFFGL